MKVVETSANVVIPENVTVEFKSRVVTVTGPRGTLKREFKHVPVEITRTGKKALKVTVWFGARKHIACIQTVVTHIKNMIKGVTTVSILTVKIFL